MHEFHLMGQVAKAVEDRLRGEPKAKPVLVRLKIRASSHLLTRGDSELQTVFALAAQGTKAEAAKLEIIPISTEAWCPHCKTAVAATDPNSPCVTCGGPVLAGEAGPEVLVHEVVVEE